MATIEIKNNGFNFISNSTDKILIVDGKQVAEKFNGQFTVNALQQETLERLIDAGVPTEDFRVCWNWAVNQLKATETATRL